MRVPAKILIVDDEIAVQNNLVAYLEDEGFIVVTALSGEEGIENIRGEKMDLAIVDMRLPGMDGNTFIANAHAIQPQMRFIIHTGSLTYTVPRWMGDIGIRSEHLFLKPVIKMEAMVGVINDLLIA